MNPTPEQVDRLFNEITTDLKAKSDARSAAQVAAAEKWTAVDTARAQLTISEAEATAAEAAFTQAQADEDKQKDFSLAYLEWIFGRRSDEPVDPFPSE